MNLCVTGRQCQITDSLWDEIEKHVQKLNQYLPHLNANLGLIKVVIKRNKRRNFFDGSISFSVPQKHLYTYFQGVHVDEAIRDAFKHIFRELSKYKGKHFTNDSQYFRHESLRKSFLRVRGSYGFQV